MQQTKVMLVCFAILAVCVSSASADLIVNMLATGVTGPGNIVSPDGMQVTLAAPGVVTFGVYVQPQGVDGINNEGLLSVDGSFVATLGTGVLGNAISCTLASEFNATSNGASPGTIQDLNSDGRMDIGGTVQNSATGWIVPISTTYPLHRETPSLDAEFLVATIEYAVDTVDLSGTSSVFNWVRRLGNSAAGNASWTQDGIPMTGNKNTPETYRSAGSIEMIPIPEPSTLILLGMGALALLAIRRRK
jgi:hypothetical protein